MGGRVGGSTRQSTAAHPPAETAAAAQPRRGKARQALGAGGALAPLATQGADPGRRGRAPARPAAAAATVAIFTAIVQSTTRMIVDIYGYQYQSHL